MGKIGFKRQLNFWWDCIRDILPGTLSLLFFGAVILASGFGWVWNIVKVVAIAGDPLTGMFFLRIVGIFVAPLGVILGYL